MQTGQVKTFMKSLRLEWILNAQYMTKVYLPYDSLSESEKC